MLISYGKEINQETNCVEGLHDPYLNHNESNLI